MTAIEFIQNKLTESEKYLKASAESWRDENCRKEVEMFRAVLNALEAVKDYHELIYAVASKHDGETRHQTALRYITERERRESQPCQPCQAS